MTQRHFFTGIVLSLLLVPQFSFAQGKIEPQKDDKIESDFRTCMSATAVWRISDKFSIDGGYTMLTNNCVSNIFRNQFSIGGGYSPCKPLRLGVGYSYMAQYSKNNDLRPKHRVYFTAEGTLKTGNWKFSLYEKFQLTHSAYEIDPNCKVKNSLDLKSRIKAAYTPLKLLEPYALVELWNCFNDPSYSAEYDASTKTYRNTVFLGYNDAFITRIRGSVGLKLKLSEHHSLDFSYAFDYCRHKNLKYDSDLGNIELYKWNNKLAHNLSMGYVFVF